MLPAKKKTGRYVLIAALALIAVIFATAGADDTPLNIGSRLELFTDNYLIDTLQGTELKLHAPHQGEKVIAFDKPWEGEFVGYCTIIEDDGLFRLYYRGYPESTKKQVTCYAESRDGISFTKPDIGIYEIDGTRKNNVILADAGSVTHNFSPFIDTRPRVPVSGRYKALGGSSKTGLIGYVSGDGIHWEKIQDTPLITEGAFDSQNVAFWSGSEGCYVCYFRTWTQGEFEGFRSISRATSKDFIVWTEPVEMSYGDTPHEHLYTNQTTPYTRAPHIYLALPMRFMPGRQVLTDAQARQLGVIGKYKGDCADCVLMTSRGGNRYDRTFMEGFIRPGTDIGNWASRAGMTVLGVIQTAPNELSIYKQANYAQPTSHLVRYTLRTDGFASVHAPYDGGTMVTRPLIFEGAELVINFSTSAAGYIRVALLDEAGKPLPGFGTDDSVETIGDEIDRVISWKTGADVSALAGKPVRVLFEMKDADLYSIQFR